MTELKIREGGYYRLRDGSIAGPASSTGDDTYPWYLDRGDQGKLSVTASGRYWHCGPEVSFDAIAEVTEGGEPLARPAVEVGQTWRYVGIAGRFYTPNSTYKVLSVNGSLMKLEDDDGSASNGGSGHSWAKDDDFFGQFVLVSHSAEAAARESMTKRRLLETAIEAVADRGLNYGRPEDNFRRIARLWSTHLVNRYGDGLGVETTVAVPTLDEHDVVQMMILMKIARLENSPTHMDSLVDCAGYAACGGEIAGGASV